MRAGNMGPPETRNLKPETGFTAISVRASARDDVNHPLAAI